MDAIGHKVFAALLAHGVPVEQLDIVEINNDALNQFVVLRGPAPVGVVVDHHHPLGCAEKFQDLAEMLFIDVAIGSQVDHDQVGRFVFGKELLQDG